MPVALSVRRLARSRRGASPLQAILILAAALMIVLALKQLLAGTVAPEAEAGIDRTFRGGDGSTAAAAPAPTPTPTPVPAPTPTPAPAATPPPGAVSPSAVEANKRLAAIRDEVDTAYAASYVAYGRPADTAGREKYDRFMKQLDEKYVSQPIEVPLAGFHGVIFRPRNPGDKAILAVAGTDDWRDIPVDAGQLFPAPSTGGAVAGVLAGAAEGSPGRVAAEVAAYGAATYARSAYDGSLQIAAALARVYGADNVMAVGDSLGGGIATYVGAMLGVRAIGFNSAPLGAGSLENVRRYGAPGAEGNVTNVNAAGEFVSSYSPGRQVGEVITVEGRDSGWLSFLWNHSMDNIDTERGVAYRPAPTRPR